MNWEFNTAEGKPISNIFFNHYAKTSRFLCTFNWSACRCLHLGILEIIYIAKSLQSYIFGENLPSNDGESILRFNRSSSPYKLSGTSQHDTWRTRGPYHPEVQVPTWRQWQWSSLSMVTQPSLCDAAIGIAGDDGRGQFRRRAAEIDLVTPMIDFILLIDPSGAEAWTFPGSG